MNRIIRIIGIYILAIILLVCYLWMDYSPEVREFMIKANRARDDSKLMVFASLGLIKYSLLVISVGMIGITSFLLLKKKIRLEANDKGRTIR